MPADATSEAAATTAPGAPSSKRPPLSLPLPLPLFHGYLRKRYATHMYMGSWRFCVLQGARLRWYRTQQAAETDSQLRGEVWVQSLEPWDGRSAFARTYANAFAVRTTSKRLLLCVAQTPLDAARWRHALETALQQSKSASQVLMTHAQDDGGRRIVPSDLRRRPPTPCAFPDERPTDAPSSVSSGSDHDHVRTQVRTACGDTGCSTCGSRFRSLVVRRVVCGSCARAFCAKHCSVGTRLEHLGLRAVRRCCDHCVQRQQFIRHLKTMTRVLGPIASRSVSMDDLVARADEPGAVVVDMKGRDEVLAPVLEKLRRRPMTLNRTIKILYQTRKKPQLFRVACERLPFYTETCVDRLENLWYQLLHLVQCLDAEPKPRCALQLFYLQRYIRAICRRCPRIALQTIWHVQASAADGKCHNLHPHTLLSLLGFIYPNTTLPESSHMFSVWKDIVFADCPEHQLAQILADLRQVNADMEKLIALEPDSMMERWLNATTRSQFESCAAELAASGIELCEFQSSILYDSLEIEGSSLSDDLPGSGINSLVLEQVSFVQSLAAISERLRHIQPVSDRGKYLAGELEILNSTLRSSALYPLSAASDELYRVVRIPPAEGKVFSTKMRAPTLIFVETVPLQSAGAIGLDDCDSGRLRPFVFSSQPCNSTFFESAVFDENEVSGVSLSGETMMSPGSSSTVAFMTPMSTVAEPVSCPIDVARYQDSTVSAGTNGKVNGCSDSASYLRTNTECNGQEAPASATGRRHTSIMPHLPQPSRGCKMGVGTRAGRLGAESFVYDSKVFGESWEERKARIQSESPMGKMPGWDLFSVIIKTNDDLRQEVFTMQLIHKLKSIFEFEAPELWLRTYRIVATGANIGLLETITDACSLDHLKKTFPGGDLSEYFRSAYGDVLSPEFIAAQRRFIESLAAYSIVSYVLLLKDRHNGNILLSSEGRIIHIDFGFILGIAPGGMFSVEDAPFKLTKEMVDVMGGVGSTGYAHFRHCLVKGFVALRKYSSEITALLQTTGQHSPFPCFHGAKLGRIVADLRTRLCVGCSRRDIRHRVDQLIRKSYNAWGTRQYDSFQLRSNNIHP